MASKARKAFDNNCGDIDRLLEIHGDIGGDAVGRRWGLEVLNKSAIVLLTAFWEAYCEDIAAEGLEFVVENAPSWTALPKELQKQVATELRADQNHLAIWDLADGGWRTVLSQRLTALTEERNRRLNTPKSGQIDDLFLRALGIPSISSSWTWSNMSKANAVAKLDGFVTLRGSIAHRGTASRSVRKGQVDEYYALVKRLVGKTGGRVKSHVKRATGKDLW